MLELELVLELDLPKKTYEQEDDKKRVVVIYDDDKRDVLKENIVFELK